MEKRIILVVADRNQADKLGRILQAHHYATQHLQSLQKFEYPPENDPLVVVVIDLDTIALSNFDVRNFKRANPNVPLLVISDKSFHPDLRESIRSHIFACISKPVDPDELIFLLNGAFESNAASIHSR